MILATFKPKRADDLRPSELKPGYRGVFIESGTMDEGTYAGEEIFLPLDLRGVGWVPKCDLEDIQEFPLTEERP